MKYLVRTILLFPFLISILFCNSKQETICVEYQKHENEREAEHGRIYFHSRDGMWLLLDRPVNQRVRMRPDQFVYYYPDDKIALIMNNRDHALAPAFLQLFLYTDREDPGLTELGFILREHTAHGDTLIKTWELKGVKKREYVRIDMYYHRERVYRSVSTDASGNVIKEVFFSDWQKGETYHYPMHVKITDEDRTQKYGFKNLHFLTQVPDSVIQLFMIPQDCEIHEYNW